MGGDGRTHHGGGGAAHLVGIRFDAELLDVGVITSYSIHYTKLYEVVDPVTRIEGHMRVEVNLDENNVIRNAVSTGTMWRGLEVILKGRDPRDAWAFVERICGVCTGCHALTSVRAVEDALGIEIPKNAHLIREMMAKTLQVHDRITSYNVCYTKLLRMKAHDNSVFDFYRAAPGGVPTQVAFSQDRRWNELDMDRTKGVIRDKANSYNFV